MITLKHLIDYFEEYEFDEKSVQLNKAETITNLKKLVYMHISMLKANPGNPIYLPYYERLLKIYKITKL